MTRRLRVLHVLVQPVLVWDDGEEISPGPGTAPSPTALSELADTADRIRADVAAYEAQQQAAADDEPAGT